MDRHTTISTSIDLDTWAPNIWNISLPSDWGVCELEWECLRLISPVETAPGRATEHPPPPIPLPLQTSRRGRPASLYMSTSDSMPLAASKLWYQNSPGSLCLKNAPADLGSEDRGREKKERGWKERKHKRTRVLSGKKTKDFYVIAQCCSAPQDAIQSDRHINLCIKLIQADLSLGAWTK